jgi:hypothetical protein
MTATARAELADAIRPRYSAAAAKEKRKILEQFIAATGYHEKSAIRILNSAPSSKCIHSRQRASLYDEAVRAALIVLWEASDRVCGKRLKALLPILLPALERNGHLKLNAQIRPKLLSMSAATVDRLLRAPRSTGKTNRESDLSRSRVGVSRCAPSPIGMIRFRAAWKWTWLRTVETSTEVATSTVWC